MIWMISTVGMRMAQSECLSAKYNVRIILVNIGPDKRCIIEHLSVHTFQPQRLSSDKSTTRTPSMTKATKKCAVTTGMCFFLMPTETQSTHLAMIINHVNHSCIEFKPNSNSYVLNSDKITCAMTIKKVLSNLFLETLLDIQS